MAEVDPRDARIAELEEQLKAALARIAELEEQLGRTSRNCNKPPSSDGPEVKREAKAPTGRKPGGQKGHKGNKRELLPPQKVDKTVALHPEACSRCEGALVKKEQAPAAWRHQVVEMPPVKPHVTEYQQHSGWCEKCECFTQAQLPEGVPRGAFGPRLMALVALLAGQYRLSKRLVQQLLGDVLGVEVALGSISKLEAQVSQALAAAVEQAREHVREQHVAHLDETSWRQAREKAWLWVAVTAWVTVFQIATSRGAAVARDILGKDWVGFLVTDRWSGYGWADKGLRQVCWSHLLCDFQGFVDRGGEGRGLGEALLAQAHKMFLVAPDERRDAQARHLRAAHAWGGVRGGAPVGRGRAVHEQEDGRHGAGDSQVEGGPLHLRGRGRPGADEQHGRTCAAPRCPLAQEQLGDAQSAGRPLRRADADRGGHAQAATAQRAGVFDGLLRGFAARAARALSVALVISVRLTR